MRGSAKRVIYKCKVCGGFVDLKNEMRTHLGGHHPHAYDMEFKDIREQFTAVSPSLDNANPIRQLLKHGLAKDWKSAWNMTQELDGGRIDRMIAKAEKAKTKKGTA